MEYNQFKAEFTQLSRRVERLSKIVGYEKCLYCESQLDVNQIRSLVSELQLQLNEMTPQFMIAQKESIKQDDEARKIKKEAERVFLNECNIIKTKMMSKIRSLFKKFEVSKYDLTAISLPAISIQEQKIWDHWMEEYLDDEGGREEWMNYPNFYYYKYH
jgi:hypothetical protein